MLTLKLKFELNDIRSIASRYEYPISETELMDLKTTVNGRGFLTKNELEMSVNYNWKNILLLG